MPKLLIADDNAQITSILRDYASKEGFETVLATTGTQALELFKADIDLVLLDVMMPELDGFSVCKEIRKHSTTPIIMVTARGEDYERIMGLDIGADDYIVKPFSPAEVMARVKAVLRRIDVQSNPHTIDIDNLHVDLNAFKASIDDEELHLTKKEIELLYTLAANNKQAFSRDNLLDQVWGYSYYGDSRTVDAHMTRLRAKLDKYEHPKWEVKTVWGVGYKFEVL